MTDHGKLDSSSYHVGRFEEFMRNTRGDIQGIKADMASVKDTQQQFAMAMMAHSQQADDIQKDVGEVIAGMKELHACIQTQSAQQSSSKFKWRHISIGAVGALFFIGTLVAVAAGGEGDLLATLSRIMGILL